MGWKRSTLVIVPVIGLVLASVAFVSNQSRRHRLYSALEAVHAMRPVLESQGVTRNALYGETTPGRAFEHYQRAVDALDSIDPDGAADARTRVRVITQSDTFRPSSLSRLLATAGAQRALSELRKGAHASDATDPMDWSKSTTSDLTFAGLQALTSLCVADAALLNRAGDGESSARRLLDVVQLGSDLRATPLMIRRVVGEELLAQGLMGDTAMFQEAFPSDRLGRSLLLRGIAIVDGRAPGMLDVVAGEAVLAANSVEAALANGSSSPFALPGTSNGLTEVALVLEVYARYHRTLSAIDTVDPREVIPAAKALVSECKSRGLHTSRVLPFGDHHQTVRVQQLARIRALALAIGSDLGLTPNFKSDRGGDEFEVEVTADTVVVTSTSSLYPEVSVSIPRCDN